jgi:hypothetical protein
MKSECRSDENDCWWYTNEECQKEEAELSRNSYGRHKKLLVLKGIRSGLLWSLPLTSPGDLVREERKRSLEFAILEHFQG